MFARRHLLRCRAVALVIVSLLFSQLASAAYVCPAMTDSSAMAAMVAAGLPCEGTDDAQPALCHEHAADPARLFELAHAAAPTLPAVMQVLPMPPAPDVHSALPMPPAGRAETRPPPDPIFFSTLRLRV